MPEARACVYCGIPADTIDHVVPRHLLIRAGAIGLDLSKLFLIRDWELPACRECNSAIGGQVFRTLKERRECVRRHIRRKYRNVLRIPEWTDDEIAQMGPLMQREIRAGLAQQALAKQRLAWTGGDRRALTAEDLSAVFDIARRIVQEPAANTPTGDDESSEKAG